MLAAFSVDNFKLFSGPLELYLDEPGSYEFNREAIRHNIVNNGIIYGFNGSGKSALGLAIFDIIATLTDKNTQDDSYSEYLNYNTYSQYAEFSYEFIFLKQKVLYTYKKKSHNSLLYERLDINGRTVVEYDFKTNEGIIKLLGAENLQFKNPDNNMSRVKYVFKNTILSQTDENIVFKKFMDFVDHMLLFYSLKDNGYIGLRNDTANAIHEIAKKDKVAELQFFLEKCSLNYELKKKRINGVDDIYVKFEKRNVPLEKVASTGTISLIVFFFWLLEIEEKKVSFLFMDEFDAFYHYELSEKIVKEIIEIESTQALFTTHNTDLLNNDILRPDCYFLLENGKINPLNKLTSKDIRKAHNLQKMFEAGRFSSRSEA